jgi:hypothetical protein
MTDKGTVREEFPLHKACENLPLYALKLAMLPGEGLRPFSHLLKHLSKTRCRKIGELLAARWKDINGIVNFGDASRSLLRDLLQRVLDDPSLIVDIEAAARREEEVHKRMEQEQRIEAIKQRLRNMGLVK